MFTTKKIKSSLTIGRRLALARQRQDLTLAAAEQATLIRAKYLQALEADDWKAIPGRVYLQGYLRRYGDYLGLVGDKIVGEFNREFSAWSQTPTLALTTAPLKKTLAITPKLIAASFIAVAVATVFGYIGWQINTIEQKPSLVVVAPGDNILWRQAALDIVGKTSPGAVVLVNEQNVTQDEQGNFHQQITLQDGVNQIKIVAKSRFNKIASKTIKVLKTTDEKSEYQNTKSETNSNNRNPNS